MTWQATTLAENDNVAIVLQRVAALIEIEPARQDALRKVSRREKPALIGRGLPRGNDGASFVLNLLTLLRPLLPYTP